MGTKEMTRSTPAQTTRQQTRLPTAEPSRSVDIFEALEQEVSRVFDRFNGFRGWPAMYSSGWPSASGEQFFSPSMEVTESDSAVEITTELPGIDEKDIEISVADGVLTVRGEKKVEKDETKKNYRLIERSYGSFERNVALPAAADASKIKARLNKGVLKIEVPKSGSPKAQQVKITAD